MFFKFLISQKQIRVFFLCVICFMSVYRSAKTTYRSSCLIYYIGDATWNTGLWCLWVGKSTRKHSYLWWCLSCHEPLRGCVFMFKWRAHHLTCVSWLTSSLSLSCSTESSLQVAADPVLSGLHQSDAALILSSEQVWLCVCVRERWGERGRERECASLVLLFKHSIVTKLNRSDCRSSVSGWVGEENSWVSHTRLGLIRCRFGGGQGFKQLWS